MVIDMLTVRLAVEHDSEEIAVVMRAAAEEEIQRITIIGCSGLNHYIHDQISTQERDHYLVCADGHRIIGMSAWQHADNVLFLNHFFVLPIAQGRGIGRMLCQEGMLLLRKREEQFLSLDVFSANDRVKRWYRSLGMEPVLQRVWVQFPLVGREMGSTHDCKVLGMPDADRAHARYGFSEFIIESPHMTHTVGRLGEFLFRCTTFDIVEDGPALTVLAKFDPYRNLICIGSPKDISTGQLVRGTIVAESERMVGTIDDVMERLTH
jgi:ribosomal protein S18 acetylase RimI-like enzyme